MSVILSRSLFYRLSISKAEMSRMTDASSVTNVVDVEERIKPSIEGGILTRAMELNQMRVVPRIQVLLKFNPQVNARAQEGTVHIVHQERM